MASNTLPRDYDIGRTLADYQRRISFLERRLQGLFGSATPQNVATQACRVTRSSNYSVPHATTEVIPFNDEVFDNNGMHDNAVNPERITFNEAGYYVVGAGIEMEAGNDYTRILVNIQKNAGANIAFIQNAPVNNVAQRANLSTVDHFEAGDHIRLRVFQQNTAGTNDPRDLELSNDYSPIFYAAKVGF
jgi:hypothetical protein